MTFRRKGDKAQYTFVDRYCIGRACWSPGMYQHRAPLACGGSRNTGSPDSACCMRRAYHGCPEGPVGERKEGDIIHVGLPVSDAELAKKRGAEGWRPA